MKKRFLRQVPILLAVLLASMSACLPEGFVRAGSLLPASGPFAQSGAQPLQITFNGATSGSGSFRVTLPGGETIQGNYDTMGGFSTGPAGGEQSPGQTVITGADWQALYGNADATLGQISGQGTGSGDKGTLLRIQYVVDAMDNRGYGVAKDSRGNLYRLRF
jgi:hypothetical protein